MASQHVLLVLMLIFNSFISVGFNVSINTLRTIQDLIERQRCSVLINSSFTNNDSCCATCLGLSPMEYNLLGTVSIISSIPVVLLCGWMIRLLGMGPTAVTFALYAFLSALLRLSAGLLGNNHRLAYWTIMTAEIMSSGAVMAVTAIRHYVACHYFPTAYRPLVMGLVSSVAAISSMLAFLTLSPLGHSYGVNAAFAVSACVTLTSGICAVGMLVVDRKLDSTARPADDDDGDEGEAGGPAGVRATISFLVQQLGDQRVMLLIIGSGLSMMVLFQFDNNAVLFLSEQFGVTPNLAATYTGVGKLVIIIGNPICGCLTGHLRLHRVVIVVGGFLMTAAYLLLIVSSLHPLAGILLLSLGYNGAGPAAHSLLSEVVDPRANSSAVTLSTFIWTVSMSANLVITGAAVQYLSSRALGWTVGYTCQAAMPAIVMGIGLVLLVEEACQKEKPTRSAGGRDPSNE